jgi:hypothetical protein
MTKPSELERLERKLTRAMGRAIEEFSLIEAGDRILCAVSGGKDSYTMHRMLVDLRARSPSTSTRGTLATPASGSRPT